MYAYLDELCYYRITDYDHFEDFKKIMSKRDGIETIEWVGYHREFRDMITKKILKTDTKSHNDETILKIYFRSKITGKLKIMSIEPDSSELWRDNPLWYAKVTLLELVDNEPKEVSSNDYDQKAFQEIINILKDYRSDVERKFSCKVDMASYYNWKSSYKFYINDDFIILSDGIYMYKFSKGDIIEIYSCFDNKLINKNEYPDTYNVKCIYENYIEYLSTNEFIKYESDLYVNKDALINKAINSNIWHAKDFIECSIIIAYVMIFCLSLVGLLGKRITLIKWFFAYIFISAIFLRMYHKVYDPISAINELMHISKKYIPADTKSYVKANKAFGKNTNKSVRGDKIDIISPNPIDFFGMDFRDTIIKSVTNNELIDRKIRKINQSLKEDELLNKKSILINKVLPDINDLVDNYSFLNDKTKDNLLIALDDLEYKLSSSQNYREKTVMEFESISSVVKKQISEL